MYEVEASKVSLITWWNPERASRHFQTQASAYDLELLRSSSSQTSLCSIRNKASKLKKKKLFGSKYSAKSANQDQEPGERAGHILSEEEENTEVGQPLAGPTRGTDYQRGPLSTTPDRSPSVSSIAGVALSSPQSSVLGVAIFSPQGSVAGVDAIPSGSTTEVVALEEPVTRTVVQVETSTKTSVVMEVSREIPERPSQLFICEDRGEEKGEEEEQEEGLFYLTDSGAQTLISSFYHQSVSHFLMDNCFLHFFFTLCKLRARNRITGLHINFISYFKKKFFEIFFFDFIYFFSLIFTWSIHEHSFCRTLFNPFSVFYRFFFSIHVTFQCARIKLKLILGC